MFALVVAGASLLVGCGGSSPSVVLKYTTPTSRVEGPLYIEVRGSSGLVDAIRRTVVRDRSQKGLVFTVVPAAHGAKDCSRTIRFPGGRATSRKLRRFVGQRVTLVMFGNRGGPEPPPGRGSSASLFCDLPEISVQLIH
jgi:hypothetical protein